jgi:anti-anti-sigma factor
VTLGAGPGEGWDSHLLLLYGDQRERQVVVGSWLRRGLERGEQVFYATSPDDAATVSEWWPRDVGVARAVRRGQLRFVPLAEFFPGAGQAALVRGALAEGYPGVRLSAQADAALSTVGAENYQSVDDEMDRLCANLPVWALCQYDAAGNDGAMLAAVIDCHPDAVQDAQMRLRRRGDHVVVSGEVDLASAEVLRRVLDRICRLDGIAGLVLDLSTLTFIDVAGCRALAAGTDRLRRAGGTVTCQGAARHILTVMSLVGMDRLPGLALA